jgi:hypothetical protein
MGVSTEMISSGQPDDDVEFEWAKRHACDVADECAARSPWPEILLQYGNVDAWHAACNVRRAADTERPLVRAITRLLADSPSKPRGALRTPQRENLLADKQLAAYWVSVAGAGDEGWYEERARIAQSDIRTLLPMWRAWGQVLLDADMGGVLDDTFEVPRI